MHEPVIIEARSLVARLRGLLGRAGLPDGQAMHIVPCSAIHTVGMKFPIDVRFYDRTGRCVREVLNVPPGRLWVGGGRHARSVLECRAGDATFADFRLPVRRKGERP